VRDATGTVANWAINIGNPLELERDGWKRSTLRIGETVAVEGIPARSESRQASAKSVTRTGKRLFGPPARRAAAPAAPAPRWADGKVRLGPVSGKTGYWASPSTKVLRRKYGCAKIPMTEDGLLLNISDADKVAPFLPWAKALYEFRQRRFFARRYLLSLHSAGAVHVSFRCRMVFSSSSRRNWAAFWCYMEAAIVTGA
jgi:hypothetical protein